MRQNQLLILLLTLSCSFSLQAKLYKWVDENGQTHFGDKVPTQYLVKEHQVINEHGATVKQVEAAETAEEKAAKREKELLQKEEEEKIAEQKKRDRVLVDTYTTERDLVAARNARLEAVDSQLTLSNSIIEDATRKLAQTELAIENIKKSNREVPDNLIKKMEREQQNLETHQRVAAGHIEKREKITEQFDGYIHRFRELLAEKQQRKQERERKLAEEQ